MTVELPVAPVDSIIRAAAGDLRVSAEAAELLAAQIQDHGAAVAVQAADRAAADGRKTLMAEDFVTEVDPGPLAGMLPVAPVDRIARLRIDPAIRVSKEARVALAAILEAYAGEVAAAAAVLARHAGRRTIQAEDIETYDALLH